jgi:hypothetical protein
MSKTILLTAFLLLSTAWIVAQQTAPDASTAPSSAPQTQTAPDTSSASQTTTTTSTSQTTTSTGSQAGTSSDANANTIQGCLNGSTGNFTLTDKSGTVYQLTGNTSDLSKHVGEEVSIRGSQSSSASGSASANAGSASGSSSTSPNASASSSANQPTFNVTDVTKISSTCSSSQK